jgi:hypothetical protein
MAVINTAVVMSPKKVVALHLVHCEKLQDMIVQLDRRPKGLEQSNPHRCIEAAYES